MKRPILPDTDVLVDFLRGHPKAVALVDAHADSILLSAVTVAELYAGVKGDEETAVLDEFVSLHRVITVTPEIARRGGLYKRDYHPSHGTGLADAMLAATADLEGADLKTLNVKHYPMIKGIAPPYTK